MTPAPYQTQDAEWLVRRLQHHRAAFLWSDMGTGKTWIMVLVADMLEAVSVLVLCPAIAREAWRREILKRQTRKRPVFVVGIDGPMPPSRFNGWIVVNYERLQDKNTGLLQDLRGRSYDAAFIDEHHYAANPEAQRTSIIYRADPDPREQVVWLAGQMKKVVLASGTPLRNSPLDLWPHLFVWTPDRMRQGGMPIGYEQFRDMYCVVRHKDLPNGATVPVIQGGQNEQDLLKRITGLYVRRRREDVIGQLPPLHVFLHELHTFGLARDRLAAAAVQMDVDPFDDADDVADALDSDEGRHAYGPLQNAALQRVDQICEVVDETLARDSLLSTQRRKVIVAAHHQDVMDAIYEGLRNMELAPVQIRGGQSAEGRQRAIDLFQDDDRVRACVLQLQAGSTAVTLTAATDMIFAELDFTAANNAQVIARAYRIGQQHPLHVRLCLGDTTVERGQARLVARRLESIEKITPDAINRALLAALRDEAPPVSDFTPFGASDDWLDGPAAPSGPTPAVADAADWLD